MIKTTSGVALYIAVLTSAAAVTPWQIAPVTNLSRTSDFGSATTSTYGDFSANASAARPLFDMPAQRSTFVAVLKEVESYLHLKEGWDGEDGAPALEEDVEAAKRLLTSLPSGVPVPKPMISSEGTVSFFWDHADVYADLEIEPNQRASLFLTRRDAGSKPDMYELTLAELTSEKLGELLSPLTRR
jgi:hypothetical protein